MLPNQRQNYNCENLHATRSRFWCFDSNVSRRTARQFHQLKHNFFFFFSPSPFTFSSSRIHNTARFVEAQIIVVLRRSGGLDCWILSKAIPIHWSTSQQLKVFLRAMIGPRRSIVTAAMCVCSTTYYTSSSIHCIRRSSEPSHDTSSFIAQEML